jgi:hypothetical protein
VRQKLKKVRRVAASVAVRAASVVTRSGRVQSVGRAVRSGIGTVRRNLADPDMRKRIIMTSIARFVAPIPIMMLTGHPGLAGATGYAVGAIADKVADRRWPSTRSIETPRLPAPRARGPVRIVAGRLVGASVAGGIAMAVDAIVGTFAPQVGTLAPGFAAHFGPRLLGAPVSFALNLIRIGLNHGYNRLMETFSRSPQRP